MSKFRAYLIVHGWQTLVALVELVDCLCAILTFHHWCPWLHGRMFMAHYNHPYSRARQVLDPPTYLAEQAPEGIEPLENDGDVNEDDDWYDKEIAKAITLWHGGWHDPRGRPDMAGVAGGRPSTERRCGMTWLELARFYFPDCTDDQLGYVLWEFTAFPLAGVAHVAKQLDHAARRGWRGMHHDAENEARHWLARERRDKRGAA